MGFALLGGLLLSLLACTSTVWPPRDLRDPVAVMLIRDAMHRGLLLPEATGFVEYGHGDWRWYALGKDSWYHVFATVLWPTRATLSRRLHAGRDAEAVAAAMPWAQFAVVQVEREAAAALRERLAAAFAAGAGELVRQPHYGMEFVPGRGSYWFGNNCADACADWLRELGCSVSWAPVRLDLAPVRE